MKNITRTIVTSTISYKQTELVNDEMKVVHNSLTVEGKISEDVDIPALVKKMTGNQNVIISDINVSENEQIYSMPVETFIKYATAK